MHAYVLCQLVSEMPTDTLSVLMAEPILQLAIFFYNNIFQCCIAEMEQECFLVQEI